MDSQGKYLFGPFLIDVRERMLRRDGHPVTLTPKAFDLLTIFVQQPGHLLTKDELLQTVWPDTIVEESNLAYNVFALRKALGDPAGNSPFIETVLKCGYRFTSAVTPVITDDVSRKSGRVRELAARRVPAPIPRRLWITAAAFGAVGFALLVAARARTPADGLPR